MAINYKKLERHPLSKAFGSISDKGDAKQFLESIRENGIEGVLMLYDGMILDGWHRYKALLELEQDPKPHCQTLPEGDDPVSYVVRHNDARRHVSKLDRVVTHIRLLEWQVSAQKLSKMPTEREIAQKLGVSAGTVNAAFQIVRSPSSKIEDEEKPSPKPKQKKAKTMGDLDLEEKNTRLEEALQAQAKTAEATLSSYKEANAKLANRVNELEAENKRLKDRIKELEAK